MEDNLSYESEHPCCCSFNFSSCPHTSCDYCIIPDIPPPVFMTSLSFNKFSSAMTKLLQNKLQRGLLLDRSKEDEAAALSPVEEPEIAPDEKFDGKVPEITYQEFRDCNTSAVAIPAASLKTSLLYTTKSLVYASPFAKHEDFYFIMVKRDFCWSAVLWYLGVVLIFFSLNILNYCSFQSNFIIHIWLICYSSLFVCL